MANVKSFIDKLHARLGDFWWYSILMFVALRFGDVINAVIGLWLVPKYVPQEELGAVLPLTQFATTIALPITIAATVFTRYLTIFKTRNEFGKIKSLLIWFFGFVVAATTLSAIVAKFTLPALFERIRVEDGSLTMLIIAAGTIGTITPVFNNALQGLKKFNTITLINLFSAPIRFITMIITLPIRALSGYMVGQILPQIFAIGASLLTLRKELPQHITTIPFWKNSAKQIFIYFIWVAFACVPGQILTIVQTTIIRQRLPEIESAAYYMISRFSELATFAGATIIFVMLPFIVEANTQGKENPKSLYQMYVGTITFGIACTATLYFGGEFILNVFPTTRQYTCYSTDMALLAVNLVLGYLWGNFTAYETANNRFGYMWYNIPITTIEVVFIIAFCGHTYFIGKLPNEIVSWMGSCQIATLRNILLTLIYFNMIRIAANIIDHALHILKAFR